MDQDFTPEQLETMKLIIMGLLAIPIFFAVRFFFYLILPRGILKMFHKKQGYKKGGVLEKEKKFYEDD
ncbi:MAG: hypothetical protein ACLFR0_07990 [Alphaproteobacteria bacterium]